MEEQRFAVVFTGKLAQDVSPEQARRTAAERFKLDPAQVDALFCGGRVIVKRDLDRTTCESVVRALRSAGLVCAVGELRPRETPRPTAAPARGGEVPPPVAAADDDGHPPPPSVSADEDDDDWPPSPPRHAAPDNTAPRIGKPNAAQVVPAVLGRYGEAKGAYPRRKAPAKKLKNALAACFLSEDEKVYGVLDVSVFGSCKECLVFAEDGVNYSMGKKDKGFIPYREWVELAIAQLDECTIALGDEHRIGMGINTPMPPAEGVLLLQEIQEELKKSMAAPGKAASIRHSSGRRRERPREIDKALTFILSPYAARERVHAAPNIPPQRVEEVFAVGRVPRDEQALGLICLKIMGKYDKYLLFTNKGLHYRGGALTMGFIPFSEFPALEFVKDDMGKLKLGHYADLDINGQYLKWYELCAVLSAVQDYASAVVLGRKAFEEPKKSAIVCPRCGSANLGATTQSKPGYLWGFVGMVVGPSLPGGNDVLAAKLMADHFGKTKVFLACRHCGYGWCDARLTTPNRDD